ncbi:MAG: hypothetical protein PHU44_02600 [Syntrophales bacterium]|nr:hypothetical protein [Syntrophales bacterium]
MQDKKLPAILVAGALSLALATGVAAQAPPKASGSKAKVRQPLKQINVKGKVNYLPVMGGYYIRSKPEVYKIANQDPTILADLFKSGKTLTIVAKPHGDLLEIISIDGKPYPGVKKPKSP